MPKKKFFIIGGFVILLLLIIGYPWGVYNSLVRSHETVKAQWQQVETQYQRRFDLIPNLVESVKGMMKQEKTVFGDLAKARSQYAGKPSPENASMVEGALGRLLVIVENYPKLKSSENVSGLMAELAGTENRVAVERRRYNEDVKNYNQSIQVFPRNILANIFGFHQEQYFKSEKGSEKAPQVNF